MSSITFDSTLKNKSLDRPSDVIFDSINRFYDAKLSGGLKDDELSKIIILEGDLFANRIMQGKVSSDEIESTETLLTGFTGENKDYYFGYPHKDLDRAAKTFLEGDYVALENLGKKSTLSQPVMEEAEYYNSFKKIR